MFYFPAAINFAQIIFWNYVTDTIYRSRVQPSLLGEDTRTRVSGGNRAYLNWNEQSLNTRCSWDYKNVYWTNIAYASIGHLWESKKKKKPENFGDINIELPLETLQNFDNIPMLPIENSPAGSPPPL